MIKNWLVVFTLMSLAGCASYYDGRASDDQGIIAEIPTPDGVVFSFQCRQFNFYDFFSLDVTDCKPAVVPTWSHGPEEGFLGRDRDL